jgi:hypothetical protein
MYIGYRRKGEKAQMTEREREIFTAEDPQFTTKSRKNLKDLPPSVASFIQNVRTKGANA